MTPMRMMVLLALAACGGNSPFLEWAGLEEPDDVHIEGDHITIDRTIQFESDSDVILAESGELLDHIATVLKIHHEDVEHLRIIGHTDSQGADDHNQELSERRAAAVQRALEEREVPTRLESTGMGETQPVCAEDTDECHAKNRRVEFLIVG